MVAARHRLLSPGLRQLRDDLGLSRERMARLLDVSAKTVERWETLQRLPASARQRQDLAHISEIVMLGRAVYSADGFLRFLNVAFPVFGGNTALQMMERGHMGEVLAALAADYEGAGY